MLPWKHRTPMWADVDTSVSLLIIIYLASLSIQVPQNRGKQNNDTVTTVVRTPLWIRPCSCISFCYSSPNKSCWNGSSSRYDCGMFVVFFLSFPRTHIQGDSGYDAGTCRSTALHVKSKFNLHSDIVIWDWHPLALGATP